MVTSGNSGARAASTAPIVRELADGLTRSVLCVSSRGGTGVEHKPELADLDLVAVLEGSFVDPRTVDVGAVQGADVANDEVATPVTESGVLAGQREVAQEDDGVWGVARTP